ncbi:MAG: histidinol-phosphatase [Gemmataceae bacterium]|nr:histidinol-phosphatase [Gemmataceae bacterium]MCS7270607.1 histidinol-phosphatase [Gemmataceae bacterium]MDW8242160.1 histidinol-phosphatase [Thermogemmata sp.]
MNPAWRARYELALTATRQAGQLARRYFTATTLDVEQKTDRTPVTIADREAEALLRGVILDAFPDDGFLGEESGDQPGTSGYRWIIDPIDGTKSFIRRIPLWATLVGLEYKGEIIAGIVYMPEMDRLYHALRGEGAYLQDRKLRVSAVEQLDHALLCYSSMRWFLEAGKEAVFLELVRRTDRQRGYGDFYGFVLVAEGAADLMVDHGLSPWDIAALVPIVAEAGGQITDWQGQTTIHSSAVLASNGRLHPAALAVLQGNSTGSSANGHF